MEKKRHTRLLMPQIDSYALPFQEGVDLFVEQNHLGSSRYIVRVFSSQLVKVCTKKLKNKTHMTKHYKHETKLCDKFSRLLKHIDWQQGKCSINNWFFFPPTFARKMGKKVREKRVVGDYEKHLIFRVMVRVELSSEHT